MRREIRWIEDILTAPIIAWQEHVRIAIVVDFTLPNALDLALSANQIRFGQRSLAAPLPSGHQERPGDVLIRISRRSQREWTRAVRRDVPIHQPALVLEA